MSHSPPVRAYPISCALLTVVLLAVPLSAQSSPLSGPLADYLRLMQLTGDLSASPVSLRPTMDRSDTSVRGLRESLWGTSPSLRPADPSERNRATPTLEWHPLELRFGSNSVRPWGTNDGQLWQGRGPSVLARGGVSVRWGPITAALQPVATSASNLEFGLSPLTIAADLGPYAYPANRGGQIDLPQRFGNSAYSVLGWGDSYLRADLGPVALSLSNENHWWGPARRNAIAMTDNAPGFGHLWLGTSRPADIRIGTIEARWMWGSLWESDYFDADPANNQRYFTGLVGTYRPKWAPNLELGATRTFTMYWPSGGPSLEDLLLVLIPLRKENFQTPENPTGNDERDQMATIFARWVAPAAGFELYGEWGRGDHAVDLRDVLTQPEHAGGFTLGFQKVLGASPERIWRFGAELTTLGASRTENVRPPATAFYAHHIVRQGYTMRGQVMGAGIGPGSSQQSLQLDRFAPWGKVGVTLQRTVYDNDRFYEAVRYWDTNEVEPAITLDGVVFRGRWELTGSVTAAHLLNKYYLRDNDELNVNLGLGARFHLGAR